MKIQLPDGQRINLEENISLVEKVEIVENLIEEFIETIINNWNSDSIRFFLDGLSDYLVWHKESSKKNEEDKDVLSINKVKEMKGKRKSKTIPFTSLTELQKETLGLEVDGDSN